MRLTAQEVYDKGKIERMDSLRWIVHFLELTRKCVQIIIKKK